MQNPYNLLNRSFEVGLTEISSREQVSGLAYSPIAFGLLSGKYHLKTDTPFDRINQFKQLARYNSKASWVATQRYLEIAQNYEMSLAQLSLASVNSRPYIDCNIIGATSLDQLKENLGSKNIRLSPQIIEEIDEVHAEISNTAA